MRGHGFCSTEGMRRMPTLMVCLAGLLSVSATRPDADPSTRPDIPLSTPSAAHSHSAIHAQDALRAQAEEAIRLSLTRRSLDHFSLQQIEQLAQTIVEESHRHDFDPALVMAVISVESSGDPEAVSHVGARGLMQLMPGTAEELARKLELRWEGPDTLFDPVFNVTLGIAYLGQLSDRYENMPMALAAYNWGPSRIDRRLRRGDGLPSRYIEKVMRAYGGNTPTLSRSS